MKRKGLTKINTFRECLLSFFLAGLYPKMIAKDMSILQKLEIHLRERAELGFTWALLRESKSLIDGIKSIPQVRIPEILAFGLVHIYRRTLET